MAYDQRAGPSTPGRGLPSSFGRPSESVYTQQRSSSGSGGGIGNDSGVLRSSALRSTPGPQTTQSSFGFGGMRDASTPKSVRWEDAPSSPMVQQPAFTPAQQQQQPATQYPFSLQYTGAQQQQQPQPQQQQQQNQQQNQQQQMMMQQQQQQMQTQKYQPWSSSTVTPLPAQRTSPNTSFQRSFSSSLTAPGPTQSQTPSFSSSIAVHPSRSAFNTVAASTAVVSKSSSAVTRPPPAASGTPPQSTAAKGEGVTRSYPAIVSRMKWNVLALVLLWLGPRISAVGRLYWLALDATFSVLGGDADVYLASAFSWLHRASLLILIINIIEATIMLNTASMSPSTTPGVAETKRKPSLAFPPNRAVSASAPTTSSPQTKSKSNTPRHYAQGSPLRDSIFRASAIAQGLGEGRRLPSQTPRLSSSTRHESNATPLAAFLARKQEQRMTSGGDMGDISWTSGDADLSTDSIEVDRALRAFSAGYEREMSQSIIAV